MLCLCTFSNLLQYQKGPQLFFLSFSLFCQVLFMSCVAEFLRARGTCCSWTETQEAAARPWKCRGKHQESILLMLPERSGRTVNIKGILRKQSGFVQGGCERQGRTETPL